MLWSDICLKSGKMEVINWQPGNCKDVSSDQRSLNAASDAALHSSPQYSGAKETGTHLSLSIVKFPPSEIFLLFVKKGTLQGHLLRD